MKNDITKVFSGTTTGWVKQSAKAMYGCVLVESGSTCYESLIARDRLEFVALSVKLAVLGTSPISRLDDPSQ